jgi:hypothetical protein
MLNSLAINASDRAIPSSQFAKNGQKLEQFDFLRAIFTIAIVAYKTNFFTYRKYLYLTVLRTH